MPPEPLLTEKERQSVISVLLTGGDLSTAADYISRTQAEIRATAAADEDFRAAIERAEPHVELTQLGNISKAAMREQYWRAAAWMLERRFPNRYARANPRALVPAKIKQLIEGLAEIVLSEVKAATVRIRIVNRLQTLLKRILGEDPNP
jgi:hypothetical protein